MSTFFPFPLVSLPRLSLLLYLFPSTSNPLHNQLSFLLKNGVCLFSLSFSASAFTILNQFRSQTKPTTLRQTGWTPAEILAGLLYLLMPIYRLLLAICVSSYELSRVSSFSKLLFLSSKLIILPCFSKFKVSASLAARFLDACNAFQPAKPFSSSPPRHTKSSFV